MESTTEEQLRADLASAEQEITFIIEGQENFYSFLEQKIQESPNNEVIQEIMVEFEKVMI